MIWTDASALALPTIHLAIQLVGTTAQSTAWEIALDSPTTTALSNTLTPQNNASISKTAGVGAVLTALWNAEKEKIVQLLMSYMLAGIHASMTSAWTPASKCTKPA